jgi:hypothetical protein
MKLSLILGALTFPLLVIPALLAVWLGSAGAQTAHRYAFARRSS